MEYATYTFAMTGPTKTVQFTRGVFVQTTVDLTVPDVPISQRISAVLSVPVAGTDRDAVVYTDDSNGRNMTMIHAGNGLFVGYFSLAVDGPDDWSQGLLEYLMGQGMTPAIVPPEFVGVIA